MKKTILFTLSALLLTASCPAHAQNASAADKYETMSIGSENICFIKNDGTLCELGSYDYEADKEKLTEIQGDFISVSCGFGYTAAIKGDGSLWLWGDNGSGQIGNGMMGWFVEAKEPVRIMDNVIAVSCGGEFTAAIKSDNSLWMWGRNQSGELGDGTDKNSAKPIKIMENAAAVSLGLDYTAVIKTDGSLWTWGNNAYGQLGAGTSEDKIYTPTKIMDDVVCVSAGWHHCAAVKSDGSLYTWGLNSDGALGDGTRESKNSPVKVMEDVLSVAAGQYYYTAAVKNDNSLWMWGIDEYSVLGIGTEGKPHYDIVFTPVKILDGVEAISAGFRSAAALKTDGTLWLWGEDFGRFDDSGAGYIKSPLKIAENVMLSSEAASRAEPPEADLTGKPDVSYDIPKHIYSTDIRAYINGIEVPSCNIGGRTAVIVEDVTNSYYYNDETRSLVITGLAPDELKGGASDMSDNPGEIIADIYQTDINTYVYHTAFPSYNIGGKTAVVIEDLGNNAEFLEIGGRYFWNEAERTISLEFMYDSYYHDKLHDILQDNNASLSVKNGKAEFVYNEFFPGGMISDWSGMYDPTDEFKYCFMPVTTEINGEESVIGYHLKSGGVVISSEPQEDGGLHIVQEVEPVSVTYFDKAKFAEAAKNVSDKSLARGDITQHYDITGNVIKRINTDDYSFLYVTDYEPYTGFKLVLINADGTYHDYADDLRGIKADGKLGHVWIYEDTGAADLEYDGKDYSIDFKSGTLTNFPE